MSSRGEASPRTSLSPHPPPGALLSDPSFFGLQLPQVEHLSRLHYLSEFACQLTMTRTTPVPVGVSSTVHKNSSGSSGHSSVLTLVCQSSSTRTPATLTSVIDRADLRRDSTLHLNTIYTHGPLCSFICVSVGGGCIYFLPLATATILRHSLALPAMFTASLTAKGAKGISGERSQKHAARP